MSMDYNDVALCRYDNFMSKRSANRLKKKRKVKVNNSDA